MIGAFASTSSSSTSPRSAAGSGRCAAASARPATASSTTRSARPCRPRRGGRPRRTPTRRAARAPADHAGPDRPPDRGPPADDARRAAPLRAPARAPRRPALTAGRGPRRPPPPPRGDHAPVADRRPARRHARRRSTRSARRSRSSTRRCSRSSRASIGRSTPPSIAPTAASRRGLVPPRTPAGPGRDRRASGVPPLGLVDRRRPRRQPGRHRRHRPSGRCGSRPTTSSAATRPSRPRLMQTLAAAVSRRSAVAAAARARGSPATPRTLPEPDRQLRRRFPDEPYRQRFGFIAERLRRTRAALTGEPRRSAGRYADAAELDAELAELQDALVADGLERVAWGEVEDLRWQLATFGFHLASLEVRQHSAVHRAALEALARARPGAVEVAPGVPLARSSPRSGRSPRSRRGSARGLPPLRRQLHGLGATDVARRPRAGPPVGRPDASRRPRSTSCRCSSRRDALEGAGRILDDDARRPRVPRPPRDAAATARR